MAMTTRCPQCGIAFKVVPDQLRVRNGLVRCGECATVFDGRACLMVQVSEGFERSSASHVAPDSVPVAPIPVPPAPTQTSVAPPPAVLRGRSDIAKQDLYLGQRPYHPKPDGDDEGAFADDPGSDHDAADRMAHEEPQYARISNAQFQWDVSKDLNRSNDSKAPNGSHDAEDPNGSHDPVQANRSNNSEGPNCWNDPEALNPSYERDDAGLSDASNRDEPPIVMGEARTRYHGATDVGRAPPEFLDTAHRARLAFLRSLWGYACVVGLLILGAQCIYVYRSSIADMSPGLRPLLVRLCDSLGCEVGYARHIGRIAITSSSLQSPTGQGGATEQGDVTQLVLRASLRNLYDQPQPWPALRLDLSDLSDTVVIRKVLLPQAYLPRRQDQEPFAPGAELNIAVPIEVHGLHVNGFQLHTFFP